MNLRISVLMTTFRPGGMDVFLSGLAKQTFQEPWEIVLVDELYHRRADAVSGYADQVGLSDRLKHLPAPAPRDGTVSNYSRSLNEGLVHCDGECVVFEMDYTYLAPTVLERFWTLHRVFPQAVVSGLAHPVKDYPEITNPKGPITIFESPIEEIHPDHQTVYQDDRFRTGMGIVEMTMLAMLDDRRMYEYGYTVSPNYIVPTDWLLDINGWDEAYDEGGHGFDDMDLMSRLKHSVGCKFYMDTMPGSNAYCMEHPWSKMPETKPNPNRERHIRRARAVSMGMESPWVLNDRVIRYDRMMRLKDESRDPLVRYGIESLVSHKVIPRERNPTQLARLGWALDQVEGTVLEVGAREAQFPDADGWVRLDIHREPGMHVQADGEALPFQDDAFDTVLLMEVLEHVEDPNRLLREALRVTRNRIVITTPNEWGWEDSFNPFAPDWKEHRRYYTKDSFLEEVLSVSGDFHIIDLDYRGFAFFLAQVFKERPQVRVRASVAGIRLLPGPAPQGVPAHETLK